MKTEKIERVEGFALNRLEGELIRKILGRMCNSVMVAEGYSDEEIALSDSMYEEFLKQGL